MQKHLFRILLIFTISILVGACIANRQSEISKNVSNSNEPKAENKNERNETEKVELRGKQTDSEPQSMKPDDSGKNPPSSQPEENSGGKFENRCGWFSNPTPANAWLNDKDGEWIIGIQGGYQAEGDWAEFDDDEWVKTNGNYGYGCACMKVKVNYKTHEVIEIASATAKPLSACRKDPALNAPNE